MMEQAPLFYQNVYLTTADIDECQDGSHNCNENAECSNTVGSFECLCNPGYSGNGQNCSGKNICHYLVTNDD